MEQAGKLFKSTAGAATTVINTNPGTLHSISWAAGTLGAITVYDDGDGTVSGAPTIIATFTPTVAGQFVFPNGGIQYSNGLTIVTAAATVVTVQYS